MKKNIEWINKALVKSGTSRLHQENDIQQYVILSDQNRDPWQQLCSYSQALRPTETRERGPLNLLYRTESPGCMACNILSQFRVSQCMLSNQTKRCHCCLFNYIKKETANLVQQL